MGNKKNNALNEAIKATQTLNKIYNYEKAGVKLNFQLNIKNATEMKIFIDLMAKATEDVNQDIQALTNG